MPVLRTATPTGRTGVAAKDPIDDPCNGRVDAHRAAADAVERLRRDTARRADDE